jgi:hypothetical protein
MTTLPRIAFGRKAYGAHRTMSPTTKAKNVAASIRQREAEGRTWTWTDYGLTEGSAQAALVLGQLQPCTRHAA